jgi:NAD(P)-dependent dehydrogenase (short-subunit alcohol dehydrogenase family)
MSSDVTHKAALITGAARRIGRTIAESLALDGWKVAIHYAGSDSDAENLVADLGPARAVAIAPPHRGAIINIVDERVWRLTPHFASYTLSKAGLWSLTQTAAMALAPRIRVNAIGPGPTLPSPRQTQAQFDAVARQIPLQRPTAPAEIAAAVRFILAAPAMTGQMIALDGGQHLGWGQVQGGSDPGE